MIWIILAFYCGAGANYAHHVWRAACRNRDTPREAVLATVISFFVWPLLLGEDL